MLVKSFTDELAWDVQRQLVKSYFRCELAEKDKCVNVDKVVDDEKVKRIVNIPNALDFYGVPVITTSELAKHYVIPYQNVLTTFYKHKEYFERGVHYFFLQSNEEIEFREMNGLNKFTKLYLWTRKGSLMFTKIVNNQIGWEQYKKILDIMFDGTYMDPDKVGDRECITQDEKKEKDALQLPDNAGLKLQSNWYLKNSYRIKQICRALGISIKDFNHLLIMKIQEKFDMESIGKLYKDKNGSTPEHALDIINDFPELSEIADDMLFEFMLSTINSLCLLKEVIAMK